MKKIICILFVIFLMTSSGFAEDYIFLNQNFESNHDGVKLCPNSNLLGLKTDGDNTYLEFELINSGNSHADIILSDCEESVVISTRLCIEKKTGTSSDGATIGLKGSLFFISDDMNNVSKDLIYIRNGNITNYKTMEEGQWYKVDAVINLESQTYSVFVDGNACNGANNASLSEEFSEISAVRFLFDGMGTVKMDDLQIYKGTEVTELTGEAVIRNIYKPDSYAEGKLNGMTALHMTGSMFKEGKKVKTKYPVIDKSGDIYVSGEDFTYLTDIGYSVNENTVCFDNGIVMYTDKRRIKVSGVMYDCSLRAKYINGVLMIPIAEFFKYSNSKHFTYNDRVMLISDEPISYGERVLEEISLYMTNPRLSAEELKESFKVKAHPYIIVDDFQKLSDEINLSETKTEWLQTLKNKADALLTTPVNDYSSNLYEMSASAMDRLDLLSFMFGITKNDAYFERACMEIDAICELTDWNSSVHFLTTAELMTSMAIAYDRFYDKLDSCPARKEAIKNCIIKYGLEPAHAAYYGSFVGNASWCSVHSNWGSVCNGAVIIAALAVLKEDNEDYCYDLIKNALRGFEYSIYAASPDGAWNEGVGYWRYFLEYTGRTVKALEAAFGKDMDICLQQGMDKIGYFVRNLSNGDRNNNFHDAGELQKISSPVMFLLADKYNDANLNSLRISEMSEYGEEPTVEDIIFYNGKTGEKYMPQKDVYYRQSEIIVARQGDTQKEAFLSFHGGRNDGTHAHYDAGTFVYDKFGYRWAMDLGIDNNTYNDSDANRYKFYRVRAEGHNTLVINPDNSAGQSFSGEAKVTDYFCSEKEAMYILDLSEFYSDKAQSIKRGFFMKDDRDRVIIRDEIEELSEDNSEIYWFWHTLASGEVNGDTVVLRRGNKAIKLKFSTNADNAVLSFIPAVPFEGSPKPEKQADDSLRNKICFKATASENVYINVEISDYEDDYEVFNERLDAWKDKHNGLYLECNNALITGVAEVNTDEAVKLVLAQYLQGKLEKVLVKETDSGSDISLTIPYDKDKIYKAMLWDENMHPFVEAIKKE